MVQLLSLAAVLAAASTFIGVTAHGVHSPEDLVKRNNHWDTHKRSLADCSSTISGRALAERAAARRSDIVDKLRAERGLPVLPKLERRNFTEDSNKSHHSNLNASVATPESMLFGSRYSSLLTPEVTQGPYFVKGEFIRKNIIEGQAGVYQYLDMQFIDVNTCEPVPNIYVDLWHANSTGVYSGINAQGNGAGTEDPSNLNKTFLRGLWTTDEEGVVQFETIFPGHYMGRSTHTHVVAHSGGGLMSNGTFSGGNITHVGQVFYDEALRSDVETQEPYASNTQEVVLNVDDMWAPQQGEDDYDPYAMYTYLGGCVAEGLMTWISIGIDTSAVYDVPAAAVLTSSGGVVNSSFSLGGGPPPS